MTTANTNEPAGRKPLRLWPGVVVAVLLLVVTFVLPILVPETAMFGVIGGVLGAFLIIVWWVFLSRAPWSERLGAILLMIVALFATSRVVHESISNGMMGMMLPIIGIPVLSVALVAWAVASRHLSGGPRRISMVVTILLACGAFTLLRTSGITGAGDSDLHWRWTETPEERLLADVRDEPAPVSSAPKAAEAPDKPAPERDADKPAAPASTPPTAEISGNPARPAAGDDATARAVDAAPNKEVDWPGFRGAARDGLVHGVRIETDWSRKPPVALWHRPIGPGWSSFSVHGDMLYTQEQRGEDEVVAGYKVSTGEPVWQHRDAVRFWESNGGAGPRATPTFNNGRLYTFGATGIVNALDARDGSVVWSRNAASDTGKKVPDWGFSSSPAVVDDVVIVGVSGQLVGYELTTGKPRWFGPKHGGSYSSPQRATIDGISQILLLSSAGVTSVAPGTGALLWEHAWPGGPTIVQPAVIADRDVLINSIAITGGVGLRRLAIAQGPGGWSATERWTSAGLKPYFNDFVVHNGHAFGFDGSILACISLEDGTRKWKGGRYGNGQLVLLPDQDLLLVLSEEGELALVAASAEQFKELARFPAIEGKTWNHPVLVGDILLIRNGEEMAAFRLPLAGGSPPPSD